MPGFIPLTLPWWLLELLFVCLFDVLFAAVERAGCRSYEACLMILVSVLRSYEVITLASVADDDSLRSTGLLHKCSSATACPMKSGSSTSLAG